MKTDVDSCLKEIADWYVKKRRSMTQAELEPILLKHCENEKEVRKFAAFLSTEPGQTRFKIHLKERKESSGEYDVPFAAKLHGEMMKELKEPFGGLLTPGKFPKRDEALKKLGKATIVEVHDDGDLTVRSGGKLYVVTTDGKAFEQTASYETPSYLMEPSTLSSSTQAGKYRLDIGVQVLKHHSKLTRDEFKKILADIPDQNDTGAINYWVTKGDEQIYIEGWVDKCIAGWGYPSRYEEGAYEEFFPVAERLTPEILDDIALERGLDLLEGGWIGFPNAQNLYGVTYGIYRKAASPSYELQEIINYPARYRGEWVTFLRSRSLDFLITEEHKHRQALLPQYRESEKFRIIAVKFGEAPKIVQEFPQPSKLVETEKEPLGQASEKPSVLDVVRNTTYYRGVKDKGTRGRLGLYFTKHPEEAEGYGSVVTKVRINPARILESETAVDLAQKLGIESEYLAKSATNLIEADDLLSRKGTELGYDAFVRRGGDWVVVLNPTIVVMAPSYLKEEVAETECQLISPQYYDVLAWFNVPVPDYSFAIEPEVKERKIDAVLQQLKDGVSRIHESSVFREFLTTMAKFWEYSFGNQILIMIQRSGATRVAGFTTWRGMERHVKAGERGIAILAPCLPPKALACPLCGNPFTERELRTHLSEVHRREDITTLVREAREETVAVPTATYFKVVYVFDVSQTEGKPLPEIAVPVLSGAYSEVLYSKLMQLGVKHSLTISFEPRPEQNPEIKGMLLGKDIWVKGDEPEAQRLKTLAHEEAHYFTESVYSIPKADAEVIAESVSFVVGAHFGFDTGTRSFPYVALWAKEKKVLEQNLASIRKISGRMIEELG